MTRKYRHIQEYEKEILELRKQGLTLQHIADKSGFNRVQLKNFINRYNKKQRKIATGISIKKKGRPYKENKTHLTPHSTRHTFASLSASAGMRREELQKIIGRANYSVTADVYTHQDITALKAAMTALKR